MTIHVKSKKKSSELTSGSYLNYAYFWLLTSKLQLFSPYTKNETQEDMQI